MKDKYQKPEMGVVTFPISDVITTSGDRPTDLPEDDNWG